MRRRERERYFEEGTTTVRRDIWSIGYRCMVERGRYRYRYCGSFLRSEIGVMQSASNSGPVAAMQLYSVGNHNRYWYIRIVLTLVLKQNTNPRGETERLKTGQLYIHPPTSHTPKYDIQSPPTHIPDAVTPP